MAIKYTWLGHGTHGLEIGGKRLIVDPFFTRREKGLPRVRRDPALVARVPRPVGARMG